MSKGDKAEKKDAIGRRGFLKGAGATGTAPVLAQTKMPCTAFKRQLRNLINGMLPHPETLLSEQDVANVCAFLLALPGRRPVKDIPILNAND